MTPKRGPARQRGLAMVELAIVLPVLLLLLLAIAEFGRLFLHYNQLLQANRDAVRFLAANAWDSTQGSIQLTSSVLSQTRNLALYGSPQVPSDNQPLLPGFSVNDILISNPDARHVQLRLRYQYQPMIGITLPGFFGQGQNLQLQLNASSVMRAL